MLTNVKKKKEKEKEKEKKKRKVGENDKRKRMDHFQTEMKIPCHRFSLILI